MKWEEGGGSKSQFIIIFRRTSGQSRARSWSQSWSTYKKNAGKTVLALTIGLNHVSAVCSGQSDIPLGSTKKNGVKTTC